MSHMKATPFPLAPLQAIKQHARGVVVITKPPSALDVMLDRSAMRSRYYLKTHNGVGFPTFLARDDWRTVIGLK
jgi:hypothetical protein